MGYPPQGYGAPGQWVAPSYIVSKEGTRFISKDKYGHTRFQGLDATDVLQNTIDAAAKEKIFLGPYAFDLSEPLVYSDDIAIEGVGFQHAFDGTSIRYAGSEDFALIPADETTWRYISLENLTFRGKGVHLGSVSRGYLANIIMYATAPCPALLRTTRKGGNQIYGKGITLGCGNNAEIGLEVLNDHLYIHGLDVAQSTVAGIQVGSATVQALGPVIHALETWNCLTQSIHIEDALACFIDNWYEENTGDLPVGKTDMIYNNSSNTAFLTSAVLTNAAYAVTNINDAAGTLNYLTGERDRLVPQTTDPTELKAADRWFRSDLHQERIYDGRVRPHGQVGWVLLDSYEDTNTGTALDHDTGTITAYDLFKVLTVITGQGAGAGGVVRIRVNNIGAAVYYQNQINAGAVSQAVTQTEWYENMWDQHGFAFGWHIKGRDPTSDAPSQDRPGIQSILPGEQDDVHLLNGGLRSDVDEVNRIRVWTDFNATGRIMIWGLNLSV